MNSQDLITLDELDALMGPTVTAASGWVAATCRACDVEGLSDMQVAELAAEVSPDGVRATVTQLFTALRLRHADDRVTLATLAALEGYHLPAFK